MSVPIDVPYERSDEILHTAVDDEVVLMSIARGKYYSLDEVGARVWDLLDSPATVSGITSKLTAEYDIEAEACQYDIAALLAEMLDADVIRAADSTA